MPFKSKKQERFMQAVAHGMKPKKKGSITMKEAQKMLAHSRKGKK